MKIWQGPPNTLHALQKWEKLVSSKCTSGHRLSISAVEVADLWKTLADSASELERARMLIAAVNAAGITEVKP